MKKKLYQSDVNVYNKKLGSSSPPSYPNEMLVRICSSKNFSQLTKTLFKKKVKVCEIGCLAGNNLRFFSDKNFNVTGIEINKYLISLCRKYLKKFNVKKKIDLKLGHNLNLPLRKGELDLLVSINTIHYSYGQDVYKCLDSFKSVVKKNGVVIIETAAPNHILFKKSIRIGSLHYKFKLPTKDHRENIDIGLFDNEKQFRNILKKKFTKIEILRRTEKYYNKTYDWFVAICKV